MNISTYTKGEKYPHFILLAKDIEGHKQLRELSTRAWQHSFTMFMTRVPTYYSDIEEIVKNNPGHLIASSACIGSFLGICFLNKKEKEAREFIEWVMKIFEDDFYLEMQPAQYEEQIEYNNWLIQLSKEYNIKLIITTDSHYLKKELRETHTAYLKSADGERETSEFYRYTYVMSSDEIHDFMDDKVGRDIVNMAFANTNEINGKITSYDLAKPQKVPHLSDDRKYCSQWKETFNHMKARNKFEYINKYLTSSSEDDNYLIYLGLMNLKKMNLPNEKYEMYMNRLEQELTECWLVSERLGQPISSYLLMVRNIIQIMWNEADSLVGISRGSAGVMLINYLIGVTQMNPLEQGIYLPHWRSV